MKKLAAKLWKKLNIPKDIQLFIMRFINDEFLVGVTGVVLNKKNEVLLLKHTYRQTAWSLPGGYLKRKEHPMAGVEREIFEETELKVNIEKIVKTSHDPKTARLDISCYGKFVSGEFHPSTEVSDYGFFNFESLPDIGKRQKSLIKNVLIKETGYSSGKQTLWDRFYNLFHK